MTKLDERIKKAPEDTIKSGWVNKLSPEFALGYLQLMRADRPIGTWLLLWPALWSITMASHFYGDLTVLPNLKLIILFTLGAFVMRGAGCVVNDLWDRDADGKVERTKDRPLPSGRVSVRNAFIFLSILCLIGFIILMQLNRFTQILGFSSLFLIALYPLMKRITNWPQLVLGFTFNWGVLMGWASVSGKLELATMVMYIGSIFWTLGYDTIYAHQDKEDDATIGVKSTALLFGKKTCIWLSVFYAYTITMFIIAGWLSNMNISYYVGMLGAAAHLVYQLRKLDIDNRENCLHLFKSNHYFGIIVFISILLGHNI